MGRWKNKGLRWTTNNTPKKVKVRSFLKAAVRLMKERMRKKDCAFAGVEYNGSGDVCRRVGNLNEGTLDRQETSCDTV